MNRCNRVRNIAGPASDPLLLVVTMLLLLPRLSAAQNNSLYGPDAPPWTASATQASGSTQPFGMYDDGSIRGISSVGKRDIGCTRWIDSPYNLEAERLGRSYAQQVETTSKLITDPTIVEYVSRIAQNLLRNSEAQVQLTLTIIDSDEVSAFSVSGGFIFVDSGLILAADNEAELAGVIAHEIAHLTACHATQELAREESTNVASMPLFFRILFRRAIRNTIYSRPSRSYESEADFLGVEYLYKAGYDPQALPSFFEKMKARENQSRSSRFSALDVHPLIADRIERTQREISSLLPPVSEYKLDTSEFQAIKKKLAELQKRSGLMMAFPRQPTQDPSPNPQEKLETQTRRIGDLPTDPLTRRYRHPIELQLANRCEPHQIALPRRRHRRDGGLGGAQSGAQSVPE